MIHVPYFIKMAICFQGCHFHFTKQAVVKLRNIVKIMDLVILL